MNYSPQSAAVPKVVLFSPSHRMHGPPRGIGHWVAGLGKSRPLRAREHRLQWLATGCHAVHASLGDGVGNIACLWELLCMVPWVTVL